MKYSRAAGPFLSKHSFKILMIVSANFLSLDFSLNMKAVLLMMFFTSVPWKVEGLILVKADYSSREAAST